MSVSKSLLLNHTTEPLGLVVFGYVVDVMDEPFSPERPVYPAMHAQPWFGLGHQGPVSGT